VQLWQSLNGVIAIARSPRVQFPGACYHIIQRGNNGEPIFKQEKEKFFFLKILRLFSVMFNCSLIAYTIMDNHYHLLLQITCEK
jgi:putative transposase